MVKDPGTGTDTTPPVDAPPSDAGPRLSKRERKAAKRAAKAARRLAKSAATAETVTSEARAEG